MQNYVAKSVDVSGFDLIITDASGNKQTIKDGLSSLLMGRLRLFPHLDKNYVPCCCGFSKWCRTGVR